MLPGIAAVFADNGRGVRGDLRAVVKALLLDREARNGHRDVAGFGKLREPLLRISHLWRAFNIRRGNSNQHGEFNTASPALDGLSQETAQQPLSAPSVFNFYHPDFSPPGPVRDAGLLAPEFEIATDNSILATNNRISQQIQYYYLGNISNATNQSHLDLDRERALAARPAALLDHLDVLLLSGAMSAPARARVARTPGQYSRTSDDGRTQRALDAISLIVASPDYLIQYVDGASIMRYDNDLSRRQILKALALGAGGAVSAKLGLNSAALAAAGATEAEAKAKAKTNDYKALVFVFLYGGSDSFDMYVPSASSDYADYAASRPASLRAARDALLATNTELGFNPQLPRMHALFNAGRLALVRNVGNLIAPLSRAEFLADSPLVPFGLFAHDYQQEQWQKGIPSQPSTLISSGWGGRIADLLAPTNSVASISPAVSVAGSNFWAPGNQFAQVSIHPSNGLARLSYFDAGLRSANASREATLEALLDAAGDHPMKRQLVSDFRRAKSASVVVGDALAAGPELSTPFNAGNPLATQLRMVARLIAARDQIGVRRQVFFVGAGGWDTHGEQALLLPDLLRGLDDGIGSFYDTLLELGVADSITTLTAPRPTSAAR